MKAGEPAYFETCSLVKITPHFSPVLFFKTNQLNHYAQSHTLLYHLFGVWTKIITNILFFPPFFDG
jgi:hypothetical protein